MPTLDLWGGDCILRVEIFISLVVVLSRLWTCTNTVCFCHPRPSLQDRAGCHRKCPLHNWRTPDSLGRNDSVRPSYRYSQTHNLQKHIIMISVRSHDQITDDSMIGGSKNHWQMDYLFCSLIKLTTRKFSKLHITVLFGGNLPAFLSQRRSNAENVPMNNDTIVSTISIVDPRHQWWEARVMCFWLINADIKPISVYNWILSY